MSAQYPPKLSLIFDVTEDVQTIHYDREGQRLSFRLQKAFVFLGDSYPERFDLPVGDDDAPLKPGLYACSSLRMVTRGGRDSIAPDLSDLKPVKAQS
jgi:hypothetical protein